MRALNVMAGTKKAAKVAVGLAKAAINAVVVDVPARGSSRDAAAELRRRAEINARGAAFRGDVDGLIFGGLKKPWIQRRPGGWLARGR